MKEQRLVKRESAIILFNSKKSAVLLVININNFIVNF